MVELVHQIKDANPTLLVCSPERETLVGLAARQCGIGPERILILDGATDPQHWKLLAVSDRSDLLELNGLSTRGWANITNKEALEEVTTCLLYSSGTTALPKGVRISHWGLVSNVVCTMDIAHRYRARCRKAGRDFLMNTIAHLPMNNIGGISLYALCPFYMGGTTWWMKSYDFDSFLEHHRRYRPAYQFTVPPVWLRISKSDKVTDHFDGLEIAVTGAAPIGEGIINDVKRKLGRGRAHMAQTWGTTETTGVITATEWPAHTEKGTWSVGELCPNSVLRVVDENDEDVAEGESGELLVSGPMLAQGYHRRPEANRESFVDGFYRTGDVGMYKDGSVHIQDRKKELIKYKGNQVTPAELEALLASHPLIVDAAVVGVWDDRQQTEVPRAYVVVRQAAEGRFIAPQEVADYVKGRVAGYKQLRGGVCFVDEIPKTASGKILRRAIRSMATTKLANHSRL